MRRLILREVPQFAETRLGSDRVTRTERDKLSSGQLGVPRERLENVADIVLGDLHAFGDGLSDQMRTMLSTRNSVDMHRR